MMESAKFNHVVSFLWATDDLLNGDFQKSEFRAKLLKERFKEKSKVDLRHASLSNHGMGYVFEHLLRTFNEALNQNPGEHFTRVKVDLVLLFDPDLVSGEGVARTVNDCSRGTSGTLTLTKERIQQINPQSNVFRYGQELNPQTWAIAPSDMFILEPNGEDAENIKLGSTLSTDQLPDQRFDFQLNSATTGVGKSVRRKLSPLHTKYTNFSKESLWTI